MYDIRFQSSSSSIDIQRASVVGENDRTNCSSLRYQCRLWCFLSRVVDAIVVAVTTITFRRSTGHRFYLEVDFGVVLHVVGEEVRLRAHQQGVYGRSIVQPSGGKSCYLRRAHEHVGGTIFGAGYDMKNNWQAVVLLAWFSSSFGNLMGDQTT